MVRSGENVMLTKDEYKSLCHKALEECRKGLPNDEPLLTMLSMSSCALGLVTMRGYLFGEEKKE